MNFDTLALIALMLAAIPCGLFLLNLSVYRPLANQKPGNTEPISVLIPARNEQKNIRTTLEAVLSNRGAAVEVIVLDDHSTDSTAKIVSEFAARDPRVRLESAPPLPAGWCGKQHACHVLGKLARHPLLVFIDADVRLLPLIHFVLLGFLPMNAMRRTRWPSMSAGCGQLFIARRDAYEKCGGHAMLRDSLHDGIKLPRVFRQAGFRTDLFDATDLATCRMYHTNTETWRGLGKNATEGLAAPGTIVPMTALLLGGQVLPLVLCAFAPLLSTLGLALAVMATALAFLPRLVATALFRQSFGSALLHPLGVLALLAIQWHALARHFLGRPAEWKGRTYGPVATAHPVKAA